MPWRMQARSSHGVRALLIGLIAALAFVGVACAQQHVAQGNRVLLVGDSLLGGARPAVAQALTKAGWDPRIEAKAGTTIGYWAPRIGVLQAADPPGVYVIQLGTNECTRFQPCVPLGPYIDQIMNSVPSTHPVLWLNVQEDVPPPVGDDDRDVVNAALEAADARWPNFYLLDFNGLFAGHPEWHVGDGLHFNDAGNAVFARFLADELERFKPA